MPPIREQSVFDNRGFQHDVPKSPWRYPFSGRRQVPIHMQRTISQDSGSSIASFAQSQGPLNTMPSSSQGNISLQKIALSRNVPYVSQLIHKQCKKSFIQIFLILGEET